MRKWKSWKCPTRFLKIYIVYILSVLWGRREQTPRMLHPTQNLPKLPFRELQRYQKTKYFVLCSWANLVALLYCHHQIARSTKSEAGSTWCPSGKPDNIGKGCLRNHNFPYRINNGHFEAGGGEIRLPKVTLLILKCYFIM